MANDEHHRPQYHFSPIGQWLNDPNGLVFYDSEYHLFYQHHPHSAVHGPMHWGHAVSNDLVGWTHLPIALYPDELGSIYSGSAVIDWRNTAGFGKEAMVTIFTHHLNGRESQSIAFSTDRGRSWAKFDGNPVVDTPKGVEDFRDPKVFWFEAGDGSGHWVMLVAAGDRILFYASPDLRNWSLQSHFGPGYGCTEGVWETPELFKLPIGDGPDSRWVLVVGVANCAPAGGSGVQYFVGNFDGSVFTSDFGKDTVLWADYGPDFYASQAWNNEPAGRSIWTAWMSNWRYAQQTPTSTWRGALTFPRQLGLAETSQGYRLTQRPVDELQKLRTKHWAWQDLAIAPGTAKTLASIDGQALEILAEFDLRESRAADSFGLYVRAGKDECTAIGYDLQEQTLLVDRTTSGRTDFEPSFAAVHHAPLIPTADNLRLHILIDRSSVEVFANDGLVVLTECIFPDSTSTGLEIFSNGSGARLNSLEVYELAPAKFGKSF